MTSAIVVGSGPNGLAAAVALARSGLEVTVLEAAATIGGGARTSENTIPGLLHDDCSAVHPMGVVSPYFRSLELERYGLNWRWPEIDFVHPLDGGRAGVFHTDLGQTASELGVDGKAWAKLYRPLVDHVDELVDELFQPLLHIPDHPVRLARFGMSALQPASWIARRWETDEARALFAGMAAHQVHPLGRMTTAGLGLMFGSVGHAHGWPVAEGGSIAIANALAAALTEHGGVIETSAPVTADTDLSGADIVMFDTAPQGVLDIMGERLPRRIRRAFERWDHGPAAFKIDLAVEGGIPWTNEAARRAGTVHVGGRFEEVAAAESAVGRGQMPERPFVLVAQQYLADPSRSVGSTHPVWAYAHVPNGYTGDATEALMGQIERFAPGFRERVVGSYVRSPAELAAYNSNYVGGDIAGGANDEWQVVMRPRASPNPYSLGLDGMYICSASTPPGAGVHGMSGANAAARALSWLSSR